MRWALGLLIGLLWAVIAVNFGGDAFARKDLATKSSRKECTEKKNSLKAEINKTELRIMARLDREGLATEKHVESLNAKLDKLLQRTR